MGSFADIMPFEGDKEGEDAEQFLKDLEANFSDADLNFYKCNHLSNCLCAKSVAAKWFKTLQPSLQSDWDKLTQVFLKHFDSESSDTELSRKKCLVLLEQEVTKLNSNLGTYHNEGSGKSQAYHTHWTESVKCLAQHIGAEDSLTEEVRSLLPRTLQSLLGHQEVKDWAALESAITGVSMIWLLEKVKDKQEVEKEREDLLKKIKMLEARTGGQPSCPQTSVPLLQTFSGLSLSDQWQSELRMPYSN